MFNRTTCLFYDLATGVTQEKVVMPSKRFPPEIDSGRGLIVIEDGIVPHWEMKIDKRKVRETITHVQSITDVLTKTTSTEPVQSTDFELLLAQNEATTKVDEVLTKQINKLIGPLGSLYAEKRRQAEAGGGPLVVDDTDREAILNKAAEQDSVIAKIDSRRRLAKAEIHEATSIEAVKAIVEQVTSVGVNNG